MIVVLKSSSALICGHALQRWRNLEEKQSIYDKLKGEWDMHSADYLIMCSGDLNVHLGRHTDGFDGVHREYSICQEECYKFCLDKKLCVKYIA